MMPKEHGVKVMGLWWGEFVHPSPLEGLDVRYELSLIHI